MKYSIEQICNIVQGSFLQFHRNEPVEHLLTDSRRLIFPDTSLFFALKGPRRGGLLFLDELYKRGCRNFLVYQEVPVQRYRDVNIILVPDSLEALQQLTAHHRAQFDIPVIGITGSNGKTIVKEWLNQLLEDEYAIVRSPKSYNSQTGVPLSIWQLNESHELAIFEAGISLPGEMRRLEKIIRPGIGIFTNIGEAHSEGFPDVREKTLEKLQLFDHAHTLIYCSDHAEPGAVLEDWKKKRVAGSGGSGGSGGPGGPGSDPLQFFSWGSSSQATLVIHSAQKHDRMTTLTVSYRQKDFSFTVPFTDEASIENSITCVCVLLYLNHSTDSIRSKLQGLLPIAMRLELKSGINHCSIINDSYNSDMGSLGIALDFLNQQKQHPKRTLILSDILQSGRTEESLYKEVAELVNRKGINRIIGIGEAISHQSEQFHIERSFYSSTAEFLRHYNNSFFRDETILLKGARSFGFEDISKVLQQKAHETVMEVNLSAIVHNLNFYRKKLKPDTRIMAMVKAFSYGSGSFEIANVLQFHHVDYLAVAYADEGIELRKAGISLPIMVMNPEEQSYDSMIQYSLEPELFSFRVLGLFDEAVRRNKILLEGDRRVSVHIKLDSGMHRLGFEELEINALIVRLKNNKNLHIRSIFSHLAGSDEGEHDDFTHLQINRFDTMSSAIMQHFDYPILRHILNSSGISRFPTGAFDMVRLGIGLYGIGTNEEEQALLQNVNTLKTTISQIKQIPKGDSIGYSRKGFAAHAMTIATVPIGYADGLSRKLSNGKGRMLVKGQFAPIVGNVCMDMCMIDITNLNVLEGDEVIVFGEQYPIAKIARDLNTIPYEVLTNVSRRVKRVYFQE